MLHILNAPTFAKLTTLRLGGKAIALIDVPSSASLEALPETLKHLGGKPLPFGRGSNILATDKDLPITLIRMAQGDIPQYVPGTNNEEKVLVRISASMKLSRLLAWCAKEALSGLEGLAGIPGHVGGALAMNAGSYGTEFCNYLESIRYFTVTGGIDSCKASSCIWGYRHFSLPSKADWVLLVDATIQLTRAPKEHILQTMKQHLTKKISTQPIQAHSAGCVFKNPINAPAAGKLLDEAGFRGKQQGGVSFSTQHANFLINNNNGTAEQALELMHVARERVALMTGISLETEIKVLSCP